MNSLNLNNYLAAFEPPSIELGDETITATRDLTVTEVVKYAKQLEKAQESENVDAMIEIAREVFTLMGYPAQRLIDLPGFAAFQVLAHAFQSPFTQTNNQAGAMNGQNTKPVLANPVNPKGRRKRST